MSQTKNLRIKSRVDSQENWSLNNSKLFDKEIGYERETGRYKIGKEINGELVAWNDLEYADGSLISSSEIFNDYENNKAELPYSHVEGRDNLASFKVFLPQTLSVADNAINLDSVEGIEVGMKTTFIQIRTTPGDPGISTRENNIIKEIDGNKIIFENPITTYMKNATYPFTNNADSTYVFIVGDGTIGSQICANNFMASHAEGMFTQSGFVGHSEGLLTKAIGVGSHAEGKKTQALQEGAHAEGYMTIADGHYAHAEGTKTEATANYTHAEGFQTKATSQHAHAEGYQTEASGGISHAEGHITKAIGDRSHAEGSGTQAVGEASHAEGSGTQAVGEGSHAEGKNTQAIGIDSHVEGQKSIAEGHYSHAEGLNTHAKGPSSHSEGYMTNAIGEYSHSEGANNTASGVYSHVEGRGNIASGEASHAEGKGTKSVGIYTHSEGHYAEANGGYSHAEGSYSKANGTFSHAEGDHTQSNGTIAHAEGYETIANGNYSHSQGLRTIATGNSQHVEGKYNIEDTENKYVHIVGNGKAEDIKDENGNITTQRRSNAHTLDWEGNAWFAGDITVGKGNKKVALKDDVYTIQNLQKYYGDVSIVPSPAEWFRIEGGWLLFNLYGERLSGEVVVPYEYDGYLVTKMESGSILGGGITKLILPGSLNSVYGVDTANPQELVLCEGIKEIEGSGIAHCSALTKITIPKSINRIGEYAFYDCENLTDIYYEGSEKDWKNIQIADGNESLLNADIHYQYLAQVFHVGATAPSSVNLLWIDTTPNTGGLKYFYGGEWKHVPVACV